MKSLTTNEINLIEFVFSKSNEKTWPADIRLEYLKEIFTFKKEEFPKNVKSGDYKHHIVEWVKKCDPDLKIFKKYQVRLETFRKKDVFVCKLSNTLKEEIKRIKFPSDIDYKLFSVSKKYEIIKSNTENSNKLEFHIGKKAVKIIPYRIKNEDIPDKLKKELSDLLSKKGEITDVSVNIENYIRTVTYVSFDMEKNELFISSDSNSYAEESESEEETSIGPESRIEESLETVLSHLGIDEAESKSKEIISLSNRTLIDESTKLQHTAPSKDIAIIPFRFEFRIENEKNKTIEDIRDNFSSIQFKALKSDVEAYYTENNSLLGFKDKKVQYDAEGNSDTLKDLNKRKTYVAGYSYHVFFVENSSIEGFTLDLDLTERRFSIIGGYPKERYYEIAMECLRKHI